MEETICSGQVRGTKKNWEQIRRVQGDSIIRWRDDLHGGITAWYPRTNANDRNSEIEMKINTYKSNKF